MKGIAISGGGAKGAFTAGKLFQRKPDEYFFGHGVSTGALMLMAVLTGNFSILEAYTTTFNSMVFNKAPFKVDGFPRIFFWIWRLIKSLLTRSVTIGESKPLSVLVDSYYDGTMFMQMKQKQRVAIIGVYSITKRCIYDAHSNHHTWNQFKNFIVGSASAPIIMSLLKFGRTEASPVEEWTDGGVSDNFNARILFEKGCTEVDLYLHKSRAQMADRGPTKNVIHFGLRIVADLFSSNFKADMQAAIDAAKRHSGVLRVHYLPEEIAKQTAFYFLPSRMSEAFRQGEALAYDQALIDKFDFSKP